MSHYPRLRVFPASRPVPRFSPLRLSACRLPLPACRFGFLPPTRRGR